MFHDVGVKGAPIMGFWPVQVRPGSVSRVWRWPDEPVDGAGMGYGNNPTRGRFNTEDDTLAAIPLLMAAGADVNAQADNGRTAAHAAVEKGWGRAVRLLAENGADLDVVDNGGRTPMDLAMGNRGDRGGPAPPNAAIVAILEELTR